MNSLNGLGWEAVRQKSEKDLIDSLQNISYMLAEVETLEKLLQDTDPAEAGQFIQLNHKVSSQFARVAMRRDFENDHTGYWQGQYDAFEIVQNMMRECA